MLFLLNLPLDALRVTILNGILSLIFSPLFLVFNPTITVMVLFTFLVIFANVIILHVLGITPLVNILKFGVLVDHQLSSIVILESEENSKFLFNGLFIIALLDMFTCESLIYNILPLFALLSLKRQSVMVLFKMSELSVLILW